MQTAPIRDLDVFLGKGHHAFAETLNIHPNNRNVHGPAPQKAVGVDTPLDPSCACLHMAFIVYSFRGVTVCAMFCRPECCPSVPEWSLSIRPMFYSLTSLVLLESGVAYPPCLVLDSTGYPGTSCTGRGRVGR